MAVIVGTELKETLYVTNLTTRFPRASIRVDAHDLVDPTFAESWVSNGGRMTFTLEISEKITEMIKTFTKRRTEILAPLLYDGTNYHPYQSQLDQYLNDCVQLEKDLEAELDLVLCDFDEIRKDFESRLVEEINLALRKHRNNADLDVEVEAQELAEFYMTRKFLSEDKIRKQCGVFYDPPRLFKQVPPAGLSPEAQQAYEAAHQKNVSRIRSLLTDNYLELEVRTALGFLDTLRQLHAVGAMSIKFFNAELEQTIADPDAIALAQDDDIEEGLTLEPVVEQESHSASTYTVSMTEKRIAANAQNLNTETGKPRYNVTSYQLLQRESDILAENLKNSISMIPEVSSDVSEIHQMIRNLEVFSEMAQRWIADYNEAKAAKKKRKRRAIAEEMVIEVNMSVLTEPNEETVEIDPSDPIDCSWLDEVDIPEPILEVCEEVVIEVDGVGLAL